MAGLRSDSEKQQEAESLRRESLRLAEIARKAEIDRQVKRYRTDDDPPPWEIKD